MSNQLLVNPYPSGTDLIQRSQILNGTIVFAGAYGNPEPINWANLISGFGYNETLPPQYGSGGNASALVTALSASGGTITATAANRFVVGQKVTFVGCTTTLGLLLNGVTVTVVTASSTQFTFANASTGTGTSETGMAVSGSPFYLAGLQGSQITAPVTSLAVASGVITVTAANSFQAGAVVSFAGLSTALGLLLNAAGPLTVTSASSSAFKITSALTGSAGSDTGVATGRNPCSPYSVEFWSENASGYNYAYQQNNANLVIQQGGSAVSSPQAPIGTGTLAAAITGDIVKYQAWFSKDR